MLILYVLYVELHGGDINEHEHEHEHDERKEPRARVWVMMNCRQRWMVRGHSKRTGSRYRYLPPFTCSTP